MRTIFLAGIGNSEAEHWQRQWHRQLTGSIWLEHSDWDYPVRTEWVQDLQNVIAAVPGPKRLVAHSLGCLLVPFWADRYQDETVTDAFLVAVPDPVGANFPEQATGFAPLPRAPLPMSTTIVASENDPYGSIEHARVVANSWDARIIEVGRLGHINLSSGLDYWHDGRAILEDTHPTGSGPLNPAH